MSWLSFLLILSIVILTGIACYFWGKRAQRTKDIDSYIKRMNTIRNAEKASEKRIASRLADLARAKEKFNEQPWNDRIKALLEDR